MPSSPQPTRPDRAAITTVINNRLETEADKGPHPAKAEHPTAGRQRRSNPVVRILANLSEHARTIRRLTVTRMRSDSLDQSVYDLNDDVGLVQNEIKQLSEGHAGLSRSLKDNVGILHDEVRRLSDRVARLFTESRALRHHMDGNNSEIASYRSRITGYREEMAELATMVDLQRRSYVDITRQLATKERPDPANETSDAAYDPFVAVFRQEIQDKYDGSPDEIRHRLGIYLPHLDFLDTRKDPKIVDLGSGRGEWLQLVSEADRPVTGVFPKGTLVAEPIADSPAIDVVTADALDWLRAQPERSFDVVTALQVIERMPFERTVALMKEIMRVLRKGGKVILETPNPENLLVGAHTFWLDPARIRPLPPVLMQQLMGSLGFASVELMRHPPRESIARYRNPEELPQRLNDLLAGSDTYAIFAEKR